MTAQLEVAGPVTTARRRLVPGEAGAGGYRGLVAADGEQHVVREGLAGLGPELRDVLLADPCVVGWVNGHTHVHAIRAVVEDGAPGGFWQVTTASHIDWPQQARIIELLKTDSGLAIGCTVVDSAAPAGYLAAEDPADPAALAALARELAANDWQIRDQITADGGAGAGTAADRNAILPVDWPRA